MISSGDPVRVKRPARAPRRLRELQHQHGADSPQRMVEIIVASAPTFEEAAEGFGISVDALFNWRRRYGVEVEVA